MRTDQEINQIILDLLDICDNYINFDYLVIQNQEAYTLMKQEMTDYLKSEGI